MTDKATAERPAEEPSPLAEWAWHHTPPRRRAGKRWSRWRLRLDDQRMLWVTIVGTFIGGLVSIVLGAVILAIAVALGHRVEELHHQGALAIATALMAVLTSVSGYIWKRLSRRGSDYRRLALIATVIFSVTLTTFVLTWLGIAAGFK